MGDMSIRALARVLAERYAEKTAESWRQQITGWRKGEPIGDVNAERLAGHFGVELDFLKSERAERAAALLADRVDEIEARIAAIESLVAERLGGSAQERRDAR